MSRDTPQSRAISHAVCVDQGQDSAQTKIDPGSNRFRGKKQKLDDLDHTFGEKKCRFRRSLKNSARFITAYMMSEYEKVNVQLEPTAVRRAYREKHTC